MNELLLLKEGEIGLNSIIGDFKVARWWFNIALGLALLMLVFLVVVPQLNELVDASQATHWLAEHQDFERALCYNATLGITIPKEEPLRWPQP